MNLWIEAARPKTLIAGASPVLIGAIIALKGGYFAKTTLVCTLLFSLFIQIGTNYANDYFDFIKGADTKDRKGPRRVTQAGLVTIKEIKIATCICFIIAAICSSHLIYVGGWMMAFIACLAIVLGVLYTAGPFSLAYMGLGDLFVFIFFGPVATSGTYFLQTRTLSKDVLIAGIAPGLLSMAILIVNNLRDIEEDKRACKKTTAVRFGKNFGAFQYLFSILFSGIIPLLLTGPNHPYVWLASLSVLPAIPLIIHVFQAETPLLFNTVLVNTGKLLMLYSLLFCIGWVL
ncbi:MAG: 1,4-dihydroxy-2-naphthoate polyprenyltransferase [Simkaniaceae bacterium]|nr:1,4-dihydroxy-2-naphthoate polyprenyltransferase [Simkaniaceae bacterium]